MAGFPLTAETFSSRAAFIVGQGAQAPLASVTTLNIWINCDTIVWRWRAVVFPAATAPVTGIDVMEINSDGQIETIYSEFDNGAWLRDLGNPQCTS
jgi:hypothetical protein